MSLDSAIQHLLAAKRISAPSQSYAKDNPVEWGKVKGYLEGGERPTGVVTEMGLGLIGVEDERRAVEPPPTDPEPVPVGVVEFPRSAHIWGGNSVQAMATHDIVIASDMSQGVPKNARVNNPSLRAFAHMGFDPWNTDYTKRRSFGLTYGGGLMSWQGGNDSLQPHPQGAIRAYNAGTDTGCPAQGATHFRLDRPTTAELVLKASFYGWKIGKGFENGWDGVWSDNLFPGNLLAAGWAFGTCASQISKSAWDAGLLSIFDGLHNFGVPFVGGNTVYRSDNPAVRAATGMAMNETLEAQIAQGPAAYATMLAEAMAWHKAASGPRYFICMHICPQSNAGLLKFGLALATIAGGAYLPYQSHSDLYLPAEMKRNGQRHYLGKPTGDPVRSGNVWTREFVHTDGTEKRVTADYNNKTATFS